MLLLASARRTNKGTYPGMGEGKKGKKEDKKEKKRKRKKRKRAGRDFAPKALPPAQGDQKTAVFDAI